jgi:hypothetical protein
MTRKKSWRDIDSGKDKKSGSAQGRFRVHTPKSPRGYKSDLNKLFDKGEMPERFKEVLGGLSSQSGETAERQQLLRAARQAEAQSDFNEICTKILARFDLPDDQKLLLRILDHPEESAVRRALEQLIELDGRRPLMKRPLLSAKLSTLEQVAKEKETLEMVEMLKARL